MDVIMYGVIGAGVLGLLYSVWKTRWIIRLEEGTD